MIKTRIMSIHCTEINISPIYTSDSEKRVVLFVQEVDSVFIKFIKFSFQPLLYILNAIIKRIALVIITVNV